MLKKVAIDDIKEKDILINKDFGELQVQTIESQEGLKALFFCSLRKNGQNEGDDLILVRD